MTGLFTCAFSLFLPHFAFPSAFRQIVFSFSGDFVPNLYKTGTIKRWEGEPVLQIGSGGHQNCDQFGLAGLRADRVK